MRAEFPDVFAFFLTLHDALVGLCILKVRVTGFRDDGAGTLLFMRPSQATQHA
jgi:hypothetical protein